MKIVIQRVSKASVTVDEEKVGQIEKGLVLLVCLEVDDQEETLKIAAKKIANLRIFDDECGKMNLNISQIKGKILSVSQFTLSWDGNGGHRPSFEKSMPPQEARLKYALFNKELSSFGIDVEQGVFGSSMNVEIYNDGPVTFVLDF